MIPKDVCQICYKPLPERTRRPYCSSDQCKKRYDQENKKLGFVRNQARQKYSVPATLYIGEWLETLHYFDWKCAYCQVRLYEHIEHFIPWQFGEGTTPNNCVPACNECNNYKSGHYFDRLPTHPERKISKEAVARVHAYLLTRTKQ